MTTTETPHRALIIGVTGMSGSALAARLVSHGWGVIGVSRRRPSRVDGVAPVLADVLDADALREALAGTAPTHVFLTAWLRQDTEAENIEVNSAIVRHAVEAACAEGTVRHVALVTGLKHYLGPFENYGKGQDLPDTPFHEDEPRLDVPNFYYDQEDELFAGARRHGYTWSVHRAHTMIGFAVDTAMNMGTTLAVYAAICRETGRRFHFPGSQVQWDGLTDLTDADQLAAQLEWAATEPAAADQALNVVNGDVVRWRWLWPRLAAMLGVEPEGFDGTEAPLEQQMAGMAPTWSALAERHGLAEPDLNTLASWWHTDGDLGRPIECLTDMTRSRRAGFTEHVATLDSFERLFATLQEHRIVPPPR